MHPAIQFAVDSLNTPEQRQDWEASQRSEPWFDESKVVDWDRGWRDTLAGLAERAALRFETWEASVPVRFREAMLSDLTSDQCLDGLRRWMNDAEAVTLLIAGPPGRGKTHAAYALANAIAARAAVTEWIRPRAWTVPGLLDALRPSCESAERVWDQVKFAPLLVLDDLANVRATDWSIERLWLLADARTTNDLRTIITTNAAWTDLEATWGVPTMDRWRDRSAVVKFAGESHRKPAW